MTFDLDVFIDILEAMPWGVLQTLGISFLSFGGALILAFAVAMVDYYHMPILKELSRVYLSVFRGTPLIAQMFFLYFGMPLLFPAFRSLNSYWAGVISLSMNMGAYMSETLRGALSAVPEGQREAALTIGMTEGQLMRRVVFPQALRIALPPLSNNLIDTIKGSSVVFTVGVVDLMAVAKMKSAVGLRYFEGYAAAMLMYWLIITAATHLQRRMELRLSRAYQREEAA